MTEQLLQWIAILIAFIGLLLIAVELYFPTTSNRLKSLFEQTKPKIYKHSGLWIASYIAIWSTSVILFSLWDQSLNLVVNILFSAITIVTLLVIGISKTLIRFGVVLGKGNSVGGVGLVLALISFSIEIIQVF